MNGKKKAGRKPILARDRKSVKFVTCFTPGRAQVIKDAAERLDIKPSAYCERAVIEKIEKE